MIDLEGVFAPEKIGGGGYRYSMFCVQIFGFLAVVSAYPGLLNAEPKEEREERSFDRRCPHARGVVLDICG